MVRTRSFELGGHTFKVKVPLTAEFEAMQERMKVVSDENVNKYFTKERDLQIANAVIEIFRNSGRIDVFNKKALYIYIREMIDVKTPKITKIADKLYDIFKRNYIFYLENGYIKFH